MSSHLQSLCMDKEPPGEQLEVEVEVEVVSTRPGARLLPVQAEAQLHTATQRQIERVGVAVMVPPGSSRWSKALMLLLMPSVCILRCSARRSVFRSMR